LSLGQSAFAIVVFPEPGSPVNHITGECAIVEIAGVISRCISPSLEQICQDLAKS
jgi:hypothetical protein